MRLGLLALFGVGSLFAADTLTIFGHEWSVPVKADWEVTKDGDDAVLHMAQSRGPVPGPRRPIQFALLDRVPSQDVTIEADVRPLKRSCILVFAYRDEAHFNYAHLSTDTGTIQPVHNGIFHVYGGERVRISDVGGPPAFPAVGAWYHVVLHFSGKTGEVKVAINGKDIPALHAVDVSLHEGRVGVGSFDETADYKNVKVTSSSS